MSSLRLETVSSPRKQCKEYVGDLEDRINNWLDIQGVKMSNPIDKAYDFFNKMKNLSLQDSSSTDSSDNENNNCSLMDCSKKSSNLQSIACSPLMKKRLQKQLSSNSSPAASVSKFKLKLSFFDHMDSLQQTEEN